MIRKLVHFCHDSLLASTTQHAKLPSFSLPITKHCTVYRSSPYPMRALSLPPPLPPPKRCLPHLRCLFAAFLFSLLHILYTLYSSFRAGSQRATGGKEEEKVLSPFSLSLRSLRSPLWPKVGRRGAFPKADGSIQKGRKGKDFVRVNNVT